MHLTKYDLLSVLHTKCSKQGIRSTENWKPRLSNYKLHIKKKVKSCSIMKYFIEIDDLLLEKENFWIGTSCKNC